MKKSILLLFLSCALLTGCSTTNYNYAAKNITVRKANGTQKEYALLSVRGDSALAVLDWTEANVMPIPFSHVELIKKGSINSIIRESRSRGSVISNGALIGGLGGGVFLGFLALSFSGHDSFISFSDVAVPATLILVGGGALVGTIIGAIVDNSNRDSLPPKILSLYSNKDIIFLRSLSLYPDKEPEEMQYIK